MIIVHRLISVGYIRISIEHVPKSNIDSSSSIATDSRNTIGLGAAHVYESDKLRCNQSSIAYIRRSGLEIPRSVRLSLSVDARARAAASSSQKEQKSSGEPAHARGGKRAANVNFRSLALDTNAVRMMRSLRQKSCFCLLIGVVHLLTQVSGHPRPQQVEEAVAGVFDAARQTVTDAVGVAQGAVNTAIDAAKNGVINEITTVQEAARLGLDTGRNVIQFGANAVIRMLGGGGGQ
ncbi:uncharacterized protein LOC100120897 isoform X2 [Nasonia vitripennis]|uniref:Uncharacterized protein n=1 Tax=Nasonia vitripennis TaxID=7425 RepID=A0A7M7PX00_NASVI|nr:uncharacterized protein LOC100120897 isoform X2 [Nasonia vitripennis]